MNINQLNVIQNDQTTPNETKQICTFSLVSSKPRPKVFVSTTVRPLHWFILTVV